MDFSALMMFADIYHPSVNGNIDEYFPRAPEEEDDTKGEEGNGRVNDA